MGWHDMANPRSSLCTNVETVPIIYSVQPIDPVLFDLDQS